MEEYILWYEASPSSHACDKNYGYCSGDVRYVSNPFHAEMSDTTINEYICENCYQSLLGDI